MATVTGYTAERMQEIENAAIVDGEVNGFGHLLLTRFDTTQIDAGSVIGPTGPQGPAGATSIVVCTSATRPSGGSLFAGLAIFETDTKRFYIYDGAAWQYRGGIWLCTNATRPSSPFTGLQIYETDTKRPFIYNGTAWIYVGGSLICTSATRPTSPFEGLPIYETDTNREYIHDGSNWIQKSGPADWITPTLTNGWTNFAGYQAAQHCFLDGLVTIRGVIKTGTMGQAAFTLPVGSRPPGNLIFAVIGGTNDIGRLDVATTGVVQPTTGNSTYFSINVSFRVD